MAAFNHELEYSDTPGIDLDFIPAKEPSIAMVAPDGSRGWVPEDQVPAATQAGAKIEGGPHSEGPSMDVIKRVALKEQIEKDGSKASVIGVGVIAFPRFMTDKEIATVCDVLSTAARTEKRRLLWRDTALSFVSLLCFFYTAQLMYRVFLYILFG